MKQYPTIEKEIRFGEKIYAFDKLDGSNIRAEWHFKKGFWKFGTRKRLLGEDEEYLGEAPRLINEKYGASLFTLFKKQKWQKVICYFEFYGRKSFAGTHFNEMHTTVLIDLSIHKKGFLPPAKFLKLTEGLHVPELLYYGNCNHQFVDQVKKSQLNNMTFEGVVCKGQITSPGLPLMFKVKSEAWLTKLKDYCGDNDNLFEELL